MRKSLFRKYFAIYALIILVSFTLLGAALVVAAGNQWTKDKRQLLQDSARTVVQQADLAYQQSASDPAFTIDTWMTGVIMPLISGSNSIDIFMVKGDTGAIFESYSTPGDRLDFSGKTVARPILDAAMKNQYYAVGDMSGLLSDDYYTVGVPLTLNAQVMGAVFTSTSTSGLGHYLSQIFRIFLLSAIAVLVFTFLVVYMLTVRMVRPVRLMADAARRMARGDFSRHIPVDRDDEIGELAYAFNHMTKSLVMLEQMRRSFVANVSHELKTPMTTIAGFIDGILDGTIPPERQPYYLGIVSGEVRRLSRLVTSMLSLAKLESGEMKLNLTRFDLSELALQTMLTFEQRISDKSLQVEGMDSLSEVTVRADRDLIHQVVYNLLDNAVKFTPESGLLRISLSVQPGSAVALVRNSGDGIPASELPHVFERFYKTDRSRGLDKTGTGLGLYLVRTIINLHGGKITARSVEGEYAEFEFTLPLPAEALPPRAEGGKEKKSDKTQPLIPDA